MKIYELGLILLFHAQFTLLYSSECLLEVARSVKTLQVEVEMRLVITSDALE